MSKQKVTPALPTPAPQTPAPQTPAPQTPTSTTPTSPTPGAQAPGLQSPGSQSSGSQTPSPQTPASQTAGSDRYLTFALGGEIYALAILDITEIMEYRSLTVVPMMPPFIRGVINLRGRVVPVVDMAARFGQGSTTIGRRSAIVIVEVAGHRGDQGDDNGLHLGVMVDVVHKVVHVSSEDIEPPPAFGAGIRTDFISGMAKHNGEFIIILDVSRVLSIEEMVGLGQAAQERSAQEDLVTADG